MRKEEERKYKTYDIVYCLKEDIADELFKLYKSKGYLVGLSSVEIYDGVRGKHVVEKLDILEELSEEEYKIADEEDFKFEKELDEILKNK